MPYTNTPDNTLKIQRLFNEKFPTDNPCDYHFQKTTDNSLNFATNNFENNNCLHFSRILEFKR